MYALQDEPERSRRGLVLALGAAVALAVQGGGLWAAHEYEAPPRRKAEIVEMTIVSRPPPKPEPPPPPPEPKPEPPPPPPEPKPEPPKPKPKPRPKPKPKPRPKPKPEPPPPAPEPPKPKPEPPPPLLAGISMKSTVTAGDGPRVQVGNTMMGSVGSTAAAPVTRPGVAGGTGDGPVDGAPTAPVRTRARLKRHVKPAYPAMARSAGIEGVVHLVLTVDEKGRVIDVKVVKGLGYGLDEATVEAARRWIYEPATVDGRPVVSKVRERVRFALEE